MKKRKLNFMYRSIHNIILIMILSMPLIFADEIKKGLDIPVIDLGFDVRAIKEYGMLLIAFLSFTYSLFNGKFSRAYRVLPIMIFFLILVVINSNNVPQSILLCGFRWVFPLFLPVFLYGFVNDELMIKCYHVTSIIFIIHVILQILELFFMPPYYGTTYFGLCARVPGILSLAHAAAYFTCFYYLLIVAFEKNIYFKKIGTFLVILSLLMAGSSTGVVVFILLFMVDKFKKHRHWKTSFILLPFVMIIVFFNADQITNRKAGSSESSISTRLDFFENIWSHTSTISDTFGYSTNGAFILSERSRVKVIQDLYADSFYNTLFGNLGILITIVILFIVVVIMVRLIKNNYVLPLMFLLFFLLFSITEIITEVYPGNFYLSLTIAYFFWKNNNHGKNAIQYGNEKNISFRTLHRQ